MMYKIYFKQALQMLKQNKFISIVSILGTALAIMMIMALIVSDEVKTVNIAPEVYRDRMLYVDSEIIKDTVKGGVSIQRLTYPKYQEYFSKMKTPEAVGMVEYYMPGFSPKAVLNREGSEDRIFSISRFTNKNYWDMFEFVFIEGKSYSKEEYESGMKYAVVSESVAKKIFKGESALNRMIDINFRTYKIIGIVKDISPIFKSAYSEAWIPATSLEKVSLNESGVELLIKAKDKSDFKRIKQEVRDSEKRFAVDNAGHTIQFPGPMTQKEKTYNINKSDQNDFFEQGVKMKKRSQLAIIIILLLVPAINLSGFSLSRIKKRTAEIGVRKAFGAKKYIILMQVLYENMITSLIGGIIGLLLSYIAIYLLKEWLLEVPADASIPVQGLVSPFVFVAVFFVCLIINLISAGIPAYRASRMTIVDSLTQNDK